jgi:hypothetical protein
MAIYVRISSSDAQPDKAVNVKVGGTISDPNVQSNMHLVLVYFHPSLVAI